MLLQEPMISKAHSNVPHHKVIDKAANLLMKERPNISITPVLQSSIPLITTSSFMTPPSQSTGKTLQEKLADKQKQYSTKQLGRNIEAEIISAPVGGALKKNLNIPSIPSMPVTKPQYKFPLDSGISISQVNCFLVYFFCKFMLHHTCLSCASSLSVVIFQIFMFNS